MTSTKTTYLEHSIRNGFTSEDVRLWQALCRQCETAVGDSRKFMHFILDLAKHNEVDPLEIIKTGRLCSGQKAVNQRFIEALTLAVYEDDDGADDDIDDKAAIKSVLDLTADDDDSASYETEGEGPFDRDDNPNSADAYEIDGFVVQDEHEGTTHADRVHEMNEIRQARRSALKASARRGNFVETPAGAVALKHSLKKRVLESISEEEE